VSVADARVLGHHLPVTPHHPFAGQQALHAHRPPGMDAAGADAHFSTQPKPAHRRTATAVLAPIVARARVAQDPDSCTQLMDLPAALLTSILGHVPFQERLCVCTLVCRSFRAAAVAATNSISKTSLSSQAQCDQLSDWLRRHGGGITSLGAQGQGYCQRKPSLASLPCPVLRDLNLVRISLQPGFFATSTSLTRLVLDSCCSVTNRLATIVAYSNPYSNPLTQLSVLSSLQHLGLRALGLRFSVTNSESIFLAFPRSLLSQLVQLTYLQLGSGQVQSDAALQHLPAATALQHLDLDLQGCIEHLTLSTLQHLELTGRQPPTPAVLTGLQHLKHLTVLRLCRAPWAINLHTMPAIAVLTALRGLQLWDGTSIDPAVLAGCSQLQQLELRCRDAWDAEGSAALLAAVGQQAQLARLKLCPKRIWRPPSAAAYSALTASSTWS